MTKDLIRADPADRGGPRPLATSVSYDGASDEIRLGLNSGVTLVIPRGLVAELRGLPATHMRDLSLIGDGEALVSEVDDVHIFVPGLVNDLIGGIIPNCI